VVDTVVVVCVVVEPVDVGVVVVDTCVVVVTVPEGVWVVVVLVPPAGNGEWSCETHIPTNKSNRMTAAEAGAKLALFIFTASYLIEQPPVHPIYEGRIVCVESCFLHSIAIPS
jgi:hypothetical protein